MNNYTKTNDFLEVTEEIIPLSSQTFSKSRLQYPVGACPLFLVRGLGCQVWDLDGNEYTDFVNGLLSISLGYQDSDVDNAVKQQLTNGVNFSLPHPLEYQVAKKLVENIPCAEMVRFGKNGSDVTSAAIRLARAHTAKDLIAVGGYHGWHDWYIGSTSRDAGVPDPIKSLTLSFKYNDIDSLKDIFHKHPQKIAAVILEPVTLSVPKDNFLQQVVDLCHEHGAVSIFDEMITGFRFATGGAQQFFEVTPDLACFGKGMANGYPISAIVGKRAIMAKMADIFFSGTFGGETLSLAAAAATIDKIKKLNVCQHFNTLGEILINGLQDLIKKNNLSDFLTVKGYPCWTVLDIHTFSVDFNLKIKHYLVQEMFKQGVLWNGSHNLSFAHSESKIQKLLSAYELILSKLQTLLATQQLENELEGECLTPIFSIRT
jgi:glutamate-1-semialdehyde 2,1-aminomutase